MSANRYPMLAHPADGHGGAPYSPSKSIEDEHDGTHEDQAPPLPTAPRVRAEILAGIEQGMAEVRAGAGIPWSVVKSELEAIIASKRK